jgi:hypothetical protein
MHTNVSTISQLDMFIIIFARPEGALLKSVFRPEEIADAVLAFGALVRSVIGHACGGWWVRIH